MKRLWAPEEIKEVARTIKPGEKVYFEGFDESPSYIFVGYSTVEGTTALYISGSYYPEEGNKVIGFYGKYLLIGSVSDDSQEVNGVSIPTINDMEVVLTTEEYSGDIMQSGSKIGTYKVKTSGFINQVTCTIELTTAPSGPLTLTKNPINFSGVLTNSTSGEQVMVSYYQAKTFYFNATSTGTFKGGVTFFSA